MPVRCQMRREIRLPSCRMFLCIQFTAALLFMTIGSISLQAADKAPPHPEKDPGVVKAKEVYEEKSRLAVAAKQEVAKRRTEMSRVHARSRQASIKASRGGSAFQKSDEHLKAEQMLKHAEEAMSELLEQLHGSYRNPDAMAIRKQIQELKEKLEEEKLQNNPNGKQIAEWSMSIQSLSRKLMRMEEKIFQMDEEYKAASKKVSEAKRNLLSIKAQARMNLQPKMAAAPNPEISGLRDNIQAAIEEYSAAYSDQQAAKKELKAKMNVAIDKYNKWRAEQIRKEKEKQRKNGGKGKKGKKGKKR